MDATVSAPLSRRAALRRLGGGGLAAALAARGLRPAAAQDEAASLEVNKDLVSRFFTEALSQNRPEVVDELYSSDFVLHVSGRNLVGIPATKEFVVGVKTGIPDGAWTPRELIAEGDIVVIRVSVDGTHLGVLFGGIPPTGNRVEGLPAMAVFRVADGKLVESWGEDNFLVAFQQLGIAPSPGGPPVFTDFGSGPSAQTPVEVRQTNKTTVLRVLDEAWSAGNLAVVDELYAPDAVDHPTGAGRGSDLAAVKDQITAFRTGLPDLRITPDLIISEGDEVATRVTLVGTNTGALFGFPPINKTLVTTGIRIDRLVDGKIVETWMVLDNLRLLQQLGVIPVGPAATPAA